MGKPVFSSKYTGLESGIEVGPYRLYIGEPGSGLIVSIEAPLKTGIMVGQIADTTRREVEWRCVDGAPIAAITPVQRWRKSNWTKKGKTASRTGNLLAVTGLGYGIAGMPTSHIDTAIDATLPDAREIARALADQSYMVPPKQRKN